MLRLGEQTLAAHAWRESISMRAASVTADQDRRTQGCRCPYGCRATGATTLVWSVKACRSCCPEEAKRSGRSSDSSSFSKSSGPEYPADRTSPFWALSCSLRGRDQSEIVFGVLKIVLRGDRVATCVSVARQLKVFFRYMQRRAANSNVIVSAAPRRPSELLPSGDVRGARDSEPSSVQEAPRCPR